MVSRRNQLAFWTRDRAFRDKSDAFRMARNVLGAKAGMTVYLDAGWHCSKFVSFSRLAVEAAPVPESSARPLTLSATRERETMRVWLVWIKKMAYFERCLERQ